MKAAKHKAATTTRTIKKKTIDHESKDDTTVSNPRRSARLAASSTATTGQQKEPLGTYWKMLEVVRMLPLTEATVRRKTWLYNYADADTAKLDFIPGYSVDKAKGVFKKIELLPEDQQRLAFEEAFGAAFMQAFAGTFGFHGPHTIQKPDDHVWFWDKALGCWRLWLIAGTGCVNESFHLTAPPEVTIAWESELKKRGHPGLDLRTQPAFHLTGVEEEKKEVKLVDMPLVIVANSDHFVEYDSSGDVEDDAKPGSMKTSIVDETVSKHFRIPLDRIWDPCLMISFTRAIQRYRRGLVYWDPYDPLGFQEYFDEDDVDEPEETYGPYGHACWDWVFSDFALAEDNDNYLFQQDGDTYTLTLRKPDSLKGKEAAAWHADVPYGPFTAFARNVNATFWPPTPPPVLNSAGIPQATSNSTHSSPTCAITTPKSHFILASVPITRYKSGQAFDADRLSRHAAHFGVEAPALANIAAHLNVALPAQSSPAIGPTRTTRSSSRTASAVNSPS